MKFADDDSSAISNEQSYVTVMEMSLTLPSPRRPRHPHRGPRQDHVPGQRTADWRYLSRDGIPRFENSAKAAVSGNAGHNGSICGICPVNTMASAKAGDAILGSVHPADGGKLRRLMNWSTVVRAAR